MVLPIIPIGLALAAVWGGKTVYDKTKIKVEKTSEQAKQAVDGVASTIDKAANATDKAADAILQVAEKIGRGAEIYEERSEKINQSAEKFKQIGLGIGIVVLTAWSATSAFYVGMLSGFGLESFRLVDKVSVLNDIAFYATIISVCAAPIALVNAIMFDRSKQDGGSVRASILIYLLASMLFGWLFLDLFVATLFFLITIVFAVLFSIRTSLWRSAAVMYGFSFGFLYAESMLLKRPDTELMLNSGGSASLIVLMTTQRGIVGLNNEGLVTQVPWANVKGLTMKGSQKKASNVRGVFLAARNWFNEKVPRMPWDN